jgi:hypothetical protein
MANDGYNATRAAVYIQDRWQPGIHPAAYNKMKIISHFLTMEKPGKQIHYMKHANLAINTLALGGDPAVLTQSANTEVEVIGLPKTIYCYTGVSEQVLDRIVDNLEGTLKDSIENGLAEGADIEGGKIATDFTQNVVGSNTINVSEATFRVLIQKLATSAKGYYEPGVTEPAFIVHTIQMDDILGEAAFTQYQFRGDGTPLIKGWVLRAHGAAFYASNNIQNVGATMRNMLIINDMTCGIAWNRKTKIELQNFLMEHRIIGHIDLSALTLWQEYGGLYSTQVT